MTTELLKRGANPSEVGYNGATPLHLVMSKRKVCLDLVKKLLKKGADLEAKDDCDCTPLLDALHFHAANYKEIVDLLLINGADVLAVDSIGMTALHLTAETDSADNAYVMRQLIEKGVSVDAQDNSGWTPLHEAANSGSKAAAAVLIENGQSYIMLYVLMLPNLVL